MIDRTDDEMGELVRAWLQRYALAIIAAVIFIIAVIAGFEWWQNQQVAKTQAQSAELISLSDAVAAGNTARATELYNAINDDSRLKPTAALLMATLDTAENQSQTQIDYLNKASTSEDPLVTQTANWQLAQLYIADKNFTAAEQNLQALKGSAYEQQIPLLRGVIAQQQGEDSIALEAYRQAFNDNPGDTAFIEAQIAALEGKIAVESN